MVPTYIPGAPLDYVDVIVVNSWDGSPILPEGGATVEFRLEFNDNLTPGQVISIPLAIDVTYG